VFAVALKVDAFLDVAASEDEVAPLGALLETEAPHEIAEVVERDRGVRIAPKDPFEEKSRARHGSIVPRWLEAVFGLTKSSSAASAARDLAPV
jgi:hypothetical protein